MKSYKKILVTLAGVHTHTHTHTHTSYWLNKNKYIDDGWKASGIKEIW